MCSPLNASDFNVHQETCIDVNIIIVLWSIVLISSVFLNFMSLFWLKNRIWKLTFRNYAVWMSICYATSGAFGIFISLFKLLSNHAIIGVNITASILYCVVGSTLLLGSFFYYSMFMQILRGMNEALSNRFKIWIQLHITHHRKIKWIFCSLLLTCYSVFLSVFIFPKHFIQLHTTHFAMLTFLVISIDLGRIIPTHEVYVEIMDGIQRGRESNNTLITLKNAARKLRLVVIMFGIHIIVATITAITYFSNHTMQSYTLYIVPCSFFMYSLMGLASLWSSYNTVFKRKIRINQQSPLPSSRVIHSGRHLNDLKNLVLS